MPLFLFSTTGRPPRLIKKTARRIISAIKRAVSACHRVRLKTKKLKLTNRQSALARVLPMWATRSQSTCNRKYLHNFFLLSLSDTRTVNSQSSLKAAQIFPYTERAYFFEKWTVQCPSYITSIYLEESYFFPSHSSSVSLTHIK